MLIITHKKLYTEYFHFTELPFSIAPDPHFTFMSAQHKEGLAHLLYGINHGGGFVAITGEVGTGKTTLCQCLLQQLPENVEIALILNPKLSAIELLATICDELRITYDRKQPTLKTLNDALNQHLLTAHANGKRTVLIIDEAQNLSLKVLEQIRLLTNLETTKTKLLQIILVGQPELKDLLEKQELRQLNQRITARYHLLPLSLPETRNYVKHRLTVCKGDPDLFSDKAIATLYKLSRGVPRLINIICHTALLGAYSLEQRMITPDLIKRASSEALSFNNDNKNSSTLVKPLSACLILVASFYLWFYWHSQGLPIPLIKEIHSYNSPKKTNVPLNVSPSAIKKASIPMGTNFLVWLENPQLTLVRSLTDALKIWKKDVDNEQRVDCEFVQKKGLYCLYDKGNWKDLLAYNRPAIMEFTLNSGSKRYALLTKIKDGQPILTVDKDYKFPLSDVLSYWDGYFMLLTQTQQTDIKPIYPEEKSEQVVWLRNRLALYDGLGSDSKFPRYFDSDLKARVMRFQQTHDLKPDGIIGEKTLFYLEDIKNNVNTPSLLEK